MIMNGEHSHNDLHPISEADDLIKRQDIRFKYSLSDAILFLLFADKSPIKGKIRQMKEVFLMLKEVMSNQNVQPVYFERKRFGPYSEEIEHIIDQLVFSNYISISGKRNTRDFAIELTPLGVKIIKNKYYELPPETQMALKRKREEWDTHIPSGLLKYIYTHYDEYLENSILKNRYEKLHWNDENQTPKQK